MSSNLPIGFFDSGVGGLSVLSRFRKLLPSENVFYYGDLLHLPYGDKTQEELIGYAENILNFYKNKNVKAVVIACNTSSAQAYETIKDKYDFPIYPIIQSCAKLIAYSGFKKIGVFATKATVDSKVYTRELQKYNSNIIVNEISCPHWVGIVEKRTNLPIDTENDIKTNLQAMSEFAPDKIILGCTHYPYLMNVFKNYIHTDIFIDPSEIFVRYIQNDLKLKNLLNRNHNKGFEHFYVSASPSDFIENAKIFYKVTDVRQI